MKTNLNGYFQVKLIDNYNNEERVVEYQRTGDETIRNEIIEQNIPLLKSITSKFEFTTKIDRKDLVSECAIFLAEAIDSFDINKGAAFSTYARLVITQELTKYTNSYCGHGSEYYGDLIKKCRQLALTLFGEADIEFDEDTVDYVLSILKEQNKIRPAAVFVVKSMLLSHSIDNRNKSIVENVSDKEEFDRTEFIREHKEELFSVLTDSEKKLIVKIFIKRIDEEKLASTYGVTRQAINGRKQKALKKMKKVAQQYL